MQEYLTATEYLDSDHPLVMNKAMELITGLKTDVEKARALYLWVRDEIRYNPYCFRADKSTFTASYCLQAKESYCIPKAVLLAAQARAVNIPARIGLANVRNHLSTPQLLAFLRTDVFVMHGYCEMYLNGRWVKATPAFNKALCEKMGVKVLEFDGLQDSVFQPFDTAGRQHMEYLKDHGTFADLPYEYILQQAAEAYPHLALSHLSDALAGHSLEDDMR